jgi:cobalt/nickel transport system permease protein
MRFLKLIALIVLLAAAAGGDAWAMHIQEGLLPTRWYLFWYLASAPFIFWGLRDLRRRSSDGTAFVPMAALMGAAVFVISCMPVPVPVAGSCSHPTGSALASILLGPPLAALMSALALLLQALFLVHGGLTTLGANVMSMGVAGSFCSFFLFVLLRKVRVPLYASAFLAGIIGDWATYFTTAVELSLALPSNLGFAGMLGAICVAFIPTQLPLGILEGFLTAGALIFLLRKRKDILKELWGKRSNFLIEDR